MSQSCHSAGTVMFSAVLLIIMPFFLMCAADHNTFSVNSNSNGNRLTLPELTEAVGEEWKEPTLLRLVQCFKSPRMLVLSEERERRPRSKLKV